MSQQEFYQEITKQHITSAVMQQQEQLLVVKQ
jgi:hypothetical protein